MSFAKLFETEEHGQILVMLGESEDGPEVAFSFQPKGMGICSIAVNGNDTPGGLAAMKALFNSQTSDTACKIVAGAKKNLGLLISDGEEETPGTISGDACN